MVPAALCDKIQDFKIHPSREKVSGRMWGGSGFIIIGEHRIDVELWHHGSNNETTESLLPYLTVRSVDGYDSYWHCLISENAIWLHEIGWFGDSELEKQIPGGNPNFKSRSLSEEKAKELGFVLIWQR
jgi:hypothetical protein